MNIHCLAQHLHCITHRDTPPCPQTTPDTVMPESPSNLGTLQHWQCRHTPPHGCKSARRGKQAQGTLARRLPAPFHACMSSWTPARPTLHQPPSPSPPPQQGAPSWAPACRVAHVHARVGRSGSPRQLLVARNCRAEVVSCYQD